MKKIFILILLLSAFFYVQSQMDSQEQANKSEVIDYQFQNEDPYQFVNTLVNKASSPIKK